MSSSPNALERAGHALIQVSAWPGRIGSWLIVPMMFGVLLAVIYAALRLQSVFGWGFSIPLFGDDLSVIDLGELQWHLFAVVVMLSGAFTYAENSHVRVDLVYSRISPRSRAVVDLIGDVLFLLPFCAIVGWLSLRFVALAFNSGEQSDYGGLTDRYLVKAILPIGLGLLFFVGVGRIMRNIGFLLNPASRQVSIERQVGHE